MNLIRSREATMTQALVQRFEEHKLSIETHVAIMSDGVQIPVQFVVHDEFKMIPSEFVTGGIAQWRIFFGDEGTGIAAAHNSWKQGCVMINHNHSLYDEYIYVVSGRLKDYLTGDIITTPESAQDLRIPVETAATMKENVKGWYHLPAGQDHMIVALEDSEFVVKFIRK